MKPRYVIDTNVLVAASAAFLGTTEKYDVSPPDLENCQKVLDWLIAFEQSPACWLLDTEDAIQSEYRKNRTLRLFPGENYGMMVLRHKMETCCVDYAAIEIDQNGNALLDSELSALIHDTSDRKMVAAALSMARESGNECIANAGDTDWYEWEEGLKRYNIDIEQIIPEWSLACYLKKAGIT